MNGKAQILFNLMKDCREFDNLPEDTFKELEEQFYNAFQAEYIDNVYTEE